MHGMSPDKEIDYWRTQAKMMAKAADNEKADRIAFRAERDQLRAECERLRAVFEAAKAWHDAEQFIDDRIEAGEPIPNGSYGRQATKLQALRDAISSTLTPADGSGT